MPRKSVCSVVLLSWTRNYYAPLRFLSANIIREIGSYFNNMCLTDVLDDVLYVYWIESDCRSFFRFCMDIKGRPPLVQIRNLVYIFSCGPLSNLTYRVHISDLLFYPCGESPCSLSGPAALYDDLFDYIYLFGGKQSRKSSKSIQVYNRTSNHWTVIKGEMQFARCHFTAVKYQREAFFLGGCKEHSIEAFHLNTGESRLLFAGLDASQLENCGGLLGCRLMGRVGARTVLMNLRTQEVNYLKDTNSTHTKSNKRIWIFDEKVRFMCPQHVTELIYPAKYAIK